MIENLGGGLADVCLMHLLSVYFGTNKNTTDKDVPVFIATSFFDLKGVTFYINESISLSM